MIEKLIKLKQGNQLLEDFWSKFITWKELFKYNKVVIVGLFKKEIYLALAWKLVKIGQLRNSDSLEDWYEKALSFERSRREAIKEFGERKSLENLGDVKKKPVLDVPRWNPNTIEVDKCRETRRCYNCGKTGHLATRCSKPRKERREEIRTVEKMRKDFFLDRK